MKSLIYKSLIYKSIGILISVCLAIVLTVAFLAAILVGTESGSRFSLNRGLAWLEDNLAIAVTYGDVSGTLFSGLAFEEIQITQSTETTSLEIAAAELEANWRLRALLNREGRITRLAASGLQVNQVVTGPAEGPAPALADVISGIFDLPLTLILDSLYLEDTQINLDQQSFASPLLEGGLYLDNEVLRISDLHVLMAGFEASGDAALFADGFGLEADLDWSTVDGDLVLPGFENAAVAGNLMVDGSLYEMNLLHRLYSPLIVESAGQLSPGFLDNTPLRFDISHVADNVAALIPPAPAVTINGLSALVRSSGTVDSIDINGDFVIETDLADPLELHVAAQYLGDSVSFETVSLNSEQINLESSGLLTLQPSLGVDADWTLHALNLDQVLTTGQMVLTDLSGSGRVLFQTGTDAVTTLELHSLSGDMNGHPLAAEALVELTGGTISNISLDLQNAGNTLSIDGGMEDNLDFAWLVQGPELDTLLPGLSGQINGEGTLNGSLAEPEIFGDLTARDISYTTGGGTPEESTYRLAAGDIAIETRLDDYTAVIDLNGIDIPAGDNRYRIEQTRLSFSGNPAQHDAALTISSNMADFQVAVSGAYREEIWSGTVNSSSIDSTYGQWQLNDGFNLEAGPQTVNYASHCWTFLDISLCSSGSWDISEGFNISGNLENISLAYLNRLETLERINNERLMARYQEKPQGLSALQETYGIYPPVDTFIDGNVSVEFSANGHAVDIANMDFNLALQPADVSLNLLLEAVDPQQEPAPDIMVFELRQTAISAAQTDSLAEVQARFNIYQLEAGGDELQGEFSSEFIRSPDQDLTGTVNFNFPDIAWLATLVPGITDTAGNVTADIDISGTLANPVFMANVEVLDAGFTLPEYGISPQNIQANLLSTNAGQINLEGSLDSGEGTIAFSGRLTSPLQDNRGFQLVLEGQDFLAMETETIQMTVSPDFQFVFADNALDIAGSLHVPVLRMNLTADEAALGNGQINVSDDAIVVSSPADESGLNASPQQQIQDIPITAEIDLSLGEEVTFLGFGLDLRLTGDLQMRQTSDRPLVTYGNISILEGSYEIYRQQLTIESGELVFFGNMLNPALDIRAYREAGTVRAGIQINGTLRNMQSQLYSTPSLPESEVLAILITGKSFQNTNEQDQNALLGAVASLGIERGQGITNTIRSELGLDTLAINTNSDLSESSIGVGKYLTSDLFIHYDIGLFDKESSLSMDYFLSDRLKLEVESGISQSIDLTYTVEK